MVIHLQFSNFDWSTQISSHCGFTGNFDKADFIPPCVSPIKWKIGSMSYIDCLLYKNELNLITVYRSHLPAMLSDVFTVWFGFRSPRALFLLHIYDIDPDFRLFYAKQIKSSISFQLFYICRVRTITTT